MAAKRKFVRVYPDYTRKCENCGASPVVSLTGLCGPCTFGESVCSDSKEWEGEYERLHGERRKP